MIGVHYNKMIMKEYIWKDFFKISIFIGFILSLVILAQVLFAQGKPTIEVFSEECPCGPCLKAEEIAKRLLINIIQTI